MKATSAIAQKDEPRDARRFVQMTPHPSRAFLFILWCQCCRLRCTPFRVATDTDEDANECNSDGCLVMLAWSREDGGRPQTTMKKIVTRYEALAHEIAAQIRSGVLRAGDRIPSVRAFSRARGLSSNTVLQAYHLLEDRGEVKARPRSGYFVVAQALRPPADANAAVRSKASSMDELAYEVFQ